MVVYFSIIIYMKRQNEKAPIIKPFFRPPGGNEKRAFRPPGGLTERLIRPDKRIDKSRCSDHPALTGSPPNSGGEEITEEPHQEGKRLLQRRRERTKERKIKQSINFLKM